MTREEFDRIKSEINSRPLTDFYKLTPSKSGMYCCPICGSGTGAHRTGALKLYRDSNRVKCFASGCFTDKGEDTLGALCRIYRKKPVEVMKDLGYTTEDFTVMERTPTATATKPKKEPKPAQAPPPSEDYTAKYAEWHTLLLQADDVMDYLERRGIDRTTIDRFNLGYCPDWSHPTTPQYKSRRLIIPRSKGSYSARRLDGGKARKYQIVGHQGDLFNVAAFSDIDEYGNDLHLRPIVVVEGEIDAAALYQGGYRRTIGLGSIENKSAFVKQAAEMNPAAIYILALDNDPEDPDPKKSRRGQTAQAALEKEMEGAGLDYISADTSALYGEYTDAADAVLHDTDRTKFWPVFMEYVRQGYNDRKDREQAAQLEAYFRSGAGAVDLFLQAVRGDMYRPLPTGIGAVDRAIGGGLFRQTVVVLGAAPGMGKTALASQIGESIAKAGSADVLYINLEMSREQLLARSLARIAYRNGYHSISTQEILQGYKWSISTEEAVLEAADEYKRDIAGHLLYNPGEPSTDLDAIMQKIQDEKKRLGHAPLVILDYLQLVTGQINGRDEDNVATIKRTMQRLKEYAIRDDTTVIIITANNRDSMKTGESGLNSSRDTSTIEYTSDALIGIEFTAVTTGEKKIDEVRAYRRKYWKDPSDPAAVADYEQYCTGYTLKVNKNRHGAEGQEAQLVFNGACAMFTPIDTTHTEPPRRTI